MTTRYQTTPKRFALAFVAVPLVAAVAGLAALAVIVAGSGSFDNPPPQSALQMAQVAGIVLLATYGFFLSLFAFIGWPLWFVLHIFGVRSRRAATGTGTVAGFVLAFVWWTLPIWAGGHALADVPQALLYSLAFAAAGAVTGLAVWAIVYEKPEAVTA